ncbi:MAG: pyridoxal-phosphate dependent enzyme, partial [Salinivirgaceae bacterium]|nr:pyridoxal-phosphate dependent enzyme [Salinivirgaceae bacterium]
GNAGSSLAGICASQGQKAIVFVPANAPAAKLTQILMYGAKLVPVDGTYDDAFDLSIEASREFGWFNRNTAFNPLTIEGKKTVSFEIFEHFNGTIPDYIFVPVGDGVIISGIYKGFEDLLLLNLIDKIPTIVAVQSEGSNNIISNISKPDFTYKSSSTIADSISVDIPRNFYMAKQYINDYKGKVVEVCDNEIMKASVLLSKETGLFAEPAAAAAMAGFLHLKSELKNNNLSSLVLLTGSGLKDLAAVSKHIIKPEPINCNLRAVKKLLEL